MSISKSPRDENLRHDFKNENNVTCVMEDRIVDSAQGSDIL